jgi:uroporphyrinogen III methyltransferase/synthase
VPVTHRGLSTSFTVVTGHEDPWAATETDWDAVARVGGTIVVLMGAATRGDIAKRLIEGGRAPTTPVTAVQWATTPSQRTVRTTLDGLGAADVHSPAAIVIGEVAGLALDWFEARPLFGTRVLVPRAQHQAGALRDRLRDAGADAVEVPVLRIEPGDPIPQDFRPYDWVAFASANAVDAVFAAVRDARALGSVRVAAIGPGTAAVLRARGVIADLIPRESSANGLALEFPPGPGQVLLPQSAIARPTLALALQDKGWTVDTVVAYRTVANEAIAESMPPRADAVAFTSSSTVDHLIAAIGRDAVPSIVVAIGETTAETARSHGLQVAAVASPRTIDGLVNALIRAVGNRTSP